MITPILSPGADARPAELERRFLQLLPQLKRQAAVAFRGERSARREELISETLAHCWVAYRRLVQRGLAAVVYATPLARYAIKQSRSGRRVGTPLNINDVSSEYAQHRRGLRRHDLSVGEAAQRAARQLLLEDRTAGPAETAAARLDFRDWLAGLPSGKRRMALLLARGETTSAVAQRFGLSAARISQIRRELHQSWQAFQGEEAA